MNEYVRKYLHRGLAFGGLGSIVVGVVYAILGASIEGFSLSGMESLMGIVSGYVVAFVQAGSSVFNQIEGWPLAKSLGIHFASLYAVYCGAYLVNTWIPFEPLVIIIFTAIFAAVYFAVWLTVYICVKITSKRLSAKL